MKITLALLALLGLAKADHCNYEMNSYSNSNDCSGAATIIVLADDVMIGDCVPYMDFLVTGAFAKYMECSSSKIKMEVYKEDDCSGKSGGIVSYPVGTCEKGSSGSTIIIKVDGAAATTVTWASVALAMIAVHV